MKRLIPVVMLALLLTAISAQAGQMLNRNAFGVRGVAPSSNPPGWNQSLIWWKFNSTDTTNSIADFSVIGTNTAQLYMSTAAATNYSFSDGAFNSDGVSEGASPVAYVQSLSSNSVGNGLTNFTVASWIKVVGCQSALPNFQSVDRVAGSPLNGFESETSTTNWYLFVNNTYAARNVGYISTNEWKRLVASKTGNAVRIYENGYLAATGYTTRILVSLNLRWYAGGGFVDGRTGDAWYDDCYLTAYPWTDADALQDYQQGRSP